MCVLSGSVMSNSLWPHGLQSTRLLCPWDFSGKNTRMGCHSLLQGIFMIQGSNLWMSMSKHWEVVKDKEDWCVAVRGVTKSWTWLSNWKTIVWEKSQKRELWTRKKSLTRTWPCHLELQFLASKTMINKNCYLTRCWWYVVVATWTD